MAAKPYRSVWARDTAPRRGREQPALSRAQIVRAAVELLDAEGLDALSMRRLGARLGAGATSIYWHVATKDDLLELVLDEVYAEDGFPQAVACPTWREAATRFAYGLRQALFQHPWAAQLVPAMPSIGPNALKAMDNLMSAFGKGGFTGRTLDYAVSAVVAYTLGATTPEVGLLTKVGGTEAAEREWYDAMQEQVQVAAADFPELRCRYAGYAASEVAATRAFNFDFGLTSMLDGLEVRLRRDEDGREIGEKAAGNGTATPADHSA
ncbi:TetR family transcriptional regulator [Sphaerisporangium krabiense]|uniref:AcrR family transcriptional regulator n=1 Tax=Sphaerisporangium krabiense TaxID=763782 RepID=A0A7W9DSM5_9ACTN|nr:TetR/AcrR family transcriptional regulator [Sphaerisporangium krabiense]MBB5628570.1 AcrR family transcriptional regulator [Sphaerisporangium krabiense]GII60594.1 TetR family transcriptional regulator [Sphaerisporangium krabiense]